MASTAGEEDLVRALVSSCPAVPIWWMPQMVLRRGAKHGSPLWGALIFLTHPLQINSNLPEACDGSFQLPT